MIDVSLPTFWAIRHIPTGKLLPCAYGRQGRGGSHLEPADPRFELPRLMKSKKQAMNVLNAWLRGKTIARRWGDGIDFEEEIETIPQAHRVREDMEIISVNLLIPTIQERGNEHAASQ